MRAVMLDVPQSFLDERRRLGQDVFDECWEGVLHIVNPPSSDHQRIAGTLQIVLGRLALRLGLVSTPETGYFAAADDWRVPDLVVAADSEHTARGVEGAAALVVEIRSPNDETDDKLDWYVARGVAEILVVDPVTRTAERYVPLDGRAVLTEPEPDGRLRFDLGFTVRTVEGPALQIVTEADTLTV